MGVFKSKPEVVDARQITGGAENGMELVFWVQAKEGRAEWRDFDSGEVLWLFEHYASRTFTSGYKGDWVIQHQNGSFELMRDEEFRKRYDQQ